MQLDVALTLEALVSDPEHVLGLGAVGDNDACAALGALLPAGRLAAHLPLLALLAQLLALEAHLFQLGLSAADEDDVGASARRIL